MPADPRVSVGTALCIIRDGKILMLRRKGKHAAGCWSFPGGWVDFGEMLPNAAAREALEEVGLEVEPSRLEFLGMYNNVFQEEQIQSVTVYFATYLKTGDPSILEPEKCDGLEWVDPLHLPEKCFPGLPDIVLNMIKEDIL